MEEQETKEKLSLTAHIAAELMVGFWFGIVAILVVNVVHSLEYCTEKIISRKC